MDADVESSSATDISHASLSEPWVPPDFAVQFVEEFVDAQDLEGLGFKIWRRRSARNPHSTHKLLKVYLFGWFERIRSTRALEKACLWDTRFKYLTRGDPPHHNALWRFWRDNHEVFVELFHALVRIAADSGLIGLDLHGLDGTKIRAVCSLHSGMYRDRAKKS
jgi:transposase